METDNSNHYYILEISTNATTEEIKKAYRKQFKLYHSDKNNDNLASKKLSQMINQAKEVLTNPQKRLEYDYKMGIKKRPENKPFPHNDNETTKNNRKKLIGVGILAFIGGLFIRGAFKN